MSNPDDVAVDTEQTQDAAEQNTTPAPALSGASPAVPRDERLLAAERAEFEARQAQEEAEAARAAAEEAAAKAVAVQAQAEQARAQLDAAREEAKALARAAALQVRMEEDEEREALAQARVQERSEREERLGTVRTVEDVEPQIVTVTKRSTDGFFGSLALFLVRVVAACFTGIVGWQAIVNQPAVIEALTYVGVPAATATVLPMVIGLLLAGAAVFLLFGLITRVLSAGLLAFTGAFLGFFRFGPFIPLIEGKFGFYGDREVLLAALFVILLFLGAGGWSVDAALRHKREKRKAEEV